MKTDRELLELAAKAAGVKIYESTDGTIQNRPVWVFSAGGGMGTMPYEERWNPLTDDAQALRLAVKLDICVEPYSPESSTVAYIKEDIHEVSEECKSPREWYNNDPYAATRRAIVRAAAEIGEGIVHNTIDGLPEDNYYKTQAEAFGYGRDMK